MAKALITGADGLLGSNLTRELLQRGYAVRAFVHPASKAPTLAGLPIEMVTGDVTQARQVDDAVAGCDYVFHCAAITDMRADPRLVWDVNLVGTKNITNACLNHRVRRLLFTGSASSHQFGPAQAPGTEASPFPECYRGLDYVESKCAATNWVKQCVTDRRLDAVILQPTFMLGPHDFRPSSGELVRQFVVRKLRFVSPGSRNFVHVADVAKAMAAAVERGRRGENYLLAGVNLSYLDFFRKLAGLAGIRPPLAPLPGPLLRTLGHLGDGAEKLSGKPAMLTHTLARLSCYETCYSPARAISELGMPQTPVETGLADALASLRLYGHLPESVTRHQGSS